MTDPEGWSLESRLRRTCMPYAVEIAATGDLGGPCTAKVYGRIAYAHRQVKAYIYARTLSKPFPPRPHSRSTMNYACEYKSARNNTGEFEFYWTRHVFLAARIRTREERPCFSARWMVIVPRSRVPSERVTIPRRGSAFASFRERGGRIYGARGAGGRRSR